MCNKLSQVHFTIILHRMQDKHDAFEWEVQLSPLFVFDTQHAHSLDALSVTAPPTSALAVLVGSSATLKLVSARLVVRTARAARLLSALSARVALFSSKTGVVLVRSLWSHTKRAAQQSLTAPHAQHRPSRVLRAPLAFISLRQQRAPVSPLCSHTQRAAAQSLAVQHAHPLQHARHALAASSSQTTRDARHALLQSLDVQSALRLQHAPCARLEQSLLAVPARVCFSRLTHSVQPARPRMQHMQHEVRVHSMCCRKDPARRAVCWFAQQTPDTQRALRLRTVSRACRQAPSARGVEQASLSLEGHARVWAPICSRTACTAIESCAECRSDGQCTACVEGSNTFPENGACTGLFFARDTQHARWMGVWSAAAQSEHAESATKHTSWRAGSVWSAMQSARCVLGEHAHGAERASSQRTGDAAGAARLRSAQRASRQSESAHSARTAQSPCRAGCARCAASRTASPARRTTSAMHAVEGSSRRRGDAQSATRAVQHAAGRPGCVWSAREGCSLMGWGVLHAQMHAQSAAQRQSAQHADQDSPSTRHLPECVPVCSPSTDSQHAHGLGQDAQHAALVDARCATGRSRGESVLSVMMARSLRHQTRAAVCTHRLTHSVRECCCELQTLREERVCCVHNM